MRRSHIFIPVLVLSAYIVVSAVSAQPPQPAEPRIIDFRADIMRPVQVGDSSVINLLGNVVLYHNGAVITCDSAIRYSDRRMECFGNVLINKGTTYIYGDRAEYNGEINLASVYAPIIKMVDEDAVMYTYHLSFNTLDNICTYGGGATMTQKDNLLESVRGYYNVDSQEFTSVDSVEIRNPDYMMRSDSVSYDMENEIAEFYLRSYIWNTKGEILSAKSGRYYHLTEDYHFTSDSYILTEVREIWADSIDYNSGTEDAVMRRDIQIRDDDKKVMGFGDYGEYRGEDEYAMLTRNPSVLSFEPDQDTLYVRADSMFMYTFPYEEDLSGGDLPSSARKQTAIAGETLLSPASPVDTIQPEGAAGEGQAEHGSKAAGVPAGIGETGGKANAGSKENGKTDSKANAGSEKNIKTEYGKVEESPPVAPAPPSEAAAVQQSQKESSDVKESGRESKKSARQDRKLTKGNVVSDVRDRDPIIREQSVAADTSSFANKTVTRGEVPDTLSNVPHPADSLAVIAVDSLSIPNGRTKPVAQKTAGVTSITEGQSEAPAVESPSENLPADAGTMPGMTPTQPVEEKTDSLQRVIKGHYNVRVFRNDFQAVCDSIVAFSKDSTLHFHTDPVLWSDNNQMTADLIVMYTKNSEIEKAFFIGNPFMTAEVDSIHYNQVKGKQMESYFKDNEIRRHEVIGNGETYYYMQDEETKDLIGFLVAECANITFLIEERQVNKIIYKGDPVYTIYPMEKIPLGQNLFLSGFRWLENRRPGLESVFDRTIRPSERDYFEGLPRPVFPLTQRIDADRERKTREGIWVERHDVLSALALEFLRSIGVEREE